MEKESDIKIGDIVSYQMDGEELRGTVLDLCSDGAVRTDTDGVLYPEQFKKYDGELDENESKGKELTAKHYGQLMEETVRKDSKIIGTKIICVDVVVVTPNKNVIFHGAIINGWRGSIMVTLDQYEALLNKKEVKQKCGHKRNQYISTISFSNGESQR